MVADVLNTLCHLIFAIAAALSLAAIALTIRETLPALRNLTRSI